MKPLLRALCIAAALAGAANARAEDALAADMVKRLQQRYPELEVRLQGTDSIDLLENGKSISVLDLGNLRDICRSKLGDCEEAKKRRVDLVAELRAGHGPFQLAKVRAVVRTADYIENVRRQFAQMKRGQDADEIAKIDQSVPIYRPLGRGFVRMWVQDRPNGMTPVSQRDLQEQKLTVADLDRASAANLVQEDVPPLEQTRVHPSLWMSGGNDYVGSVLLDEALWRRLAGARAGEEVAACLPERHMLIAYFPKLDPRREVDMAVLCRRAATNGAPPFSDQVIRRINDNWQIR